jgi:hypothetical protein
MLLSSPSVAGYKLLVKDLAYLTAEYIAAFMFHQRYITFDGPLTAL